jgi:hypothetical protein
LGPAAVSQTGRWSYRPQLISTNSRKSGRRVTVPNSPRIIVIVKRRPYDEAAWKRLLVAYAYALYDKRKEQTSPVVATREAQGE